ncbi:hypothetical protein AOLI_G00182310 [Acnodon oligacanthus]
MAFSDAIHPIEEAEAEQKHLQTTAPGALFLRAWLRGYISSPITSSVWVEGAPLSHHTTASLAPQKLNIPRLLYLNARVSSSRERDWAYITLRAA